MPEIEIVNKIKEKIEEIRNKIQGKISGAGFEFPEIKKRRQEFRAMVQEKIKRFPTISESTIFKKVQDVIYPGAIETLAKGTEIIGGGKVLASTPPEKVQQIKEELPFLYH